MMIIIIMGIIETPRILRQHGPVFMTDQEVTETVDSTEMVIFRLSVDSGMCVGGVHAIIQIVIFLNKVV
jgi:BioD-like phosphotransacetylase family protein